MNSDTASILWDPQSAHIYDRWTLSFGCCDEAIGPDLGTMDIDPGDCEDLAREAFERTPCGTVAVYYSADPEVEPLNFTRDEVMS